MMMRMGNPVVKAWVATASFSAAGIASLFLLAPVSDTLIPHLIFYAVLVLNTFFSIRFFSRIA
ncbi:MAG: hypothetical protein Q8P19_03115, partial [bacterium]|nr:hypothetical protein [bacterium]